MLVEYYCGDKKKSVEVDNNKTKAKERKNEFILYTYLEKSPVENKDGEKMIAPSARDFYMASMESFFKEAKEQGLITSQETINPFNIDNVEFLNDILYNLQKDDKYKVVATSKSRNNRTTAFRHLLDFVKRFKLPQIYWVNVNNNTDYWKKDYPLEKWELGENGGKIAYSKHSKSEVGDIVIFYISGNTQAIRYIGRVYKIENETVYFKILVKLAKYFTLEQVQSFVALEAYPPSSTFSQMQNDKQQAGLEITIECFKEGYDENSNLNSINKEKEMPNNNIQNKTAKNPPLNQILYGPPGTGKTYNTINKALEILGYGVQNDDKSKITLDYDKIKQKLQEIANSEDAKALNLENLDYKSERELAKLLFDYYCSTKQGQIAFVTFHQSFSYEEFVEGIKPIFVDENGNEVENSKNMIYKPKDGIFKNICKKALDNESESNKKILQEIQKEVKSNSRVWKISLGGKQAGEAPIVQEYCFRHNEIRIAHLKKENSDRIVKPFKHTMKKGDIVGVFSENSIFKAIGVIVGDYEEKEVIGDNFQNIKDFQRTRKVKWLLKNENIDSGRNLSNPQDAVFDSGIKAEDLFKKIQGKVGYVFNDLPNKITCRDLPIKPYILIIDEINRGNISKILGELITLIEPSKRIGADEELRVSLPYSANEFDGGKGFGVPKNLYIIGTMNTADRSIALLDTALRRRFDFVEMMPDCKHKEISTDCESVNLQKLLKAMNERIEFLLDREHTIGHSFFIKVNSLSELQQVFKNKIIPLLQEYFYDDYAKIDAVLNGNGMIEPKKDSTLEKLFDTNFKSDLDSEKVVYQITNSNKWNEKNFLRIYDSSVQIDKDE